MHAFSLTQSKSLWHSLSKLSSIKNPYWVLKSEVFHYLCIFVCCYKCFLTFYPCCWTAVVFNVVGGGIESELWREATAATTRTQLDPRIIVIAATFQTLPSYVIVPCLLSIVIASYVVRSVLKTPFNTCAMLKSFPNKLMMMENKIGFGVWTWGSVHDKAHQNPVCSKIQEQRVEFRFECEERILRAIKVKNIFTRTSLWGRSETLTYW